MQRRLAAAFALIALAAVVLVGLGILLLAQRGARQETTDQLVDEMEAIAELASGTRSLRNFGQALARSQQAFNFETLRVAVVTDANDLIVTAQADPVRGRRPALVPDENPSGLPQKLTNGQREQFDSGEAVILDNRRNVNALIRINARFQESDLSNIELALLGSQQVAPLPNRTILWFLLSSAIVLVGATAAGTLLARRIVRPIRSLQATTAQLAAGHLSARTVVEGEDELADLGRSVNVMASELQRSKQLDQQFLMSISHDLRTPLTAIGGYGEALVDGTAHDIPAVGRIIVGQATRLERLVQDLLDLARLDAKQFTLARDVVDAGVISGRTVAEQQASAAGEGVELRFHRHGDGPLTVIGDADRLTQVVTNLVDNAVKFARSMVQVTCTSDSGWAVISVADDGAGISSEDLPHIFDRLYAGQSQPRRAESSVGLGLTIVKELVMAMNGSVTPGEAAGGGTVFTVRLPLVTPY